MSRRTEYFPLNGGENHASPALSVPPGELIASLNYESTSFGGYRRVGGFERFDGQPKPSDAVFGDYANEAAWIVEIESRRDDIDAVTGEGNILGVWYFNDKTYAFRNNVGSTEAIMYESSATGWQAVQMDYKLAFTLGTNEIAIGDTIEGITSGATATVVHIRVDSGTWGGNDAAGDIFYHPDTLIGTFQAEDIEVGVLSSATIAGAGVLESFPPDGRYEFINYNFYGHSGSRTMYGVNGVGPSFMFDGSDVRLIHTGMVADTPNHVFAFKNHLFLSFTGGSIQHSSLGVPDEWSAITGASEIAVGDECTGFGLAASDAMAIFCRNSTFLLYGTGTSTWNLVTHSLDSGAIERSIQRLSRPLYLDDRGVTSLATTQAYGDFISSSISKKIDAILKTLKDQLTASLIVRNKNQYRMFFDDNTNITLTFEGNKLSGIMRHDYDKPVLCCCSSETSDGNEVLFFGSDDGYIYQIDSGNSFDGETVNAWIRPAFNHLKSPANIKSFSKISLEIDATEQNNLYFVPLYDYGGANLPNSEEGTFSISGGGAFWDTGLWDEFYYDTQVIGTAYGYLQGIGKNFSLYIRSEDKYTEPHTIQGVIVYYSVKGLSK